MIRILITLCTISLVLCDLSLLLLHTNDMHARFEQVDRHLGICKGNETGFCYGGFARLHYMVKHFKARAEAEGRSTLFLNAGDTFQGTPYYSQFKWKLAAKMINTLDIDAMTLGNHEFDDGVENLASFIDHVKTPVVCSNLDVSQVPFLQHSNLTSSKVLVVNGTKVGIVGYLTPTTKNNRFLGGLKMFDEISSVQEEARRLRGEGVQIIIALGHSGYDKDVEVAKKVKEIDVIVGGHTHTFLYSGKKMPELEEPSGPYPTVVVQESGKKVPVVQAYFGTKYLGFLELNFDSKGNLKSFSGSPVLLIGIFPQDSNVLNELKPYKIELDKNINKIIGYTYVFLDNNNFKCKISECEIGNLIADAFTDYMIKHCPSVPISAGLLNAGGIRGSLDPISGGHNGSITLGDIMTVMPWGKPLVVLNLPGKVLLEVLEHTVSRYEDTKMSHVNHFLQVSGLRVTYNMGREVGQRVTHVKILCTTCEVPWLKLLDSEEKYGVVVPEYLAKGGEGFSMLSNYTRQCVSEEGDYTILAKYIENYSPVNPHIEERVKMAHGEISEIILPMLYYFMTVILIFFIFKDTIMRPLNIFWSLNGEPTISSVDVKHYEYSKLISSKEKSVQY